MKCTYLPCSGTNGNDTLIERAGDDINDRIYATRGNDLLRAQTSGSDTDVLYGGRDRIEADDEDGTSYEHDRVYGERGTDTCYVDHTREVYSS
jgi:hypothetical protein